MMQKQLLPVLVMVFALAACKIDRKPVIDRDKFTFRYTDDSFLFFRNVRQIYYDIQELPLAHWYAFRWADRSHSLERPILNPVIVVDWFKKESYLLIESNEFLEDENELTVRETRPGTTASYTYSLKDRGRENMLEFATKVYEGIMARNELTIRVEGEFKPLFESEDQAETFRVVMGDYYRLTHVFTPD